MVDFSTSKYFETIFFIDFNTFAQISHQQDKTLDIQVKMAQSLIESTTHILHLNDHVLRKVFE